MPRNQLKSEALVVPKHATACKPRDHHTDLFFCAVETLLGKAVGEPKPNFPKSLSKSAAEQAACFATGSRKTGLKTVDLKGDAHNADLGSGGVDISLLDTGNSSSGRTRHDKWRSGEDLTQDTMREAVVSPTKLVQMHVSGRPDPLKRKHSRKRGQSISASVSSDGKLTDIFGEEITDPDIVQPQDPSLIEQGDAEASASSSLMATAVRIARGQTSSSGASDCQALGTGLKNVFCRNFLPNI